MSWKKIKEIPEISFITYFTSSSDFVYLRSSECIYILDKKTFNLESKIPLDGFDQFTDQKMEYNQGQLVFLVCYEKTGKYEIWNYSDNKIKWKLPLKWNGIDNLGSFHILNDSIYTVQELDVNTYQLVCYNLFTGIQLWAKMFNSVLQSEINRGVRETVLFWENRAVFASGIHGLQLITFDKGELFDIRILSSDFAEIISYNERYLAVFFSGSDPHVMIYEKSSLSLIEKIQYNHIESLHDLHVINNYVWCYADDGCFFSKRIGEKENLDEAMSNLDAETIINTDHGVIFSGGISLSKKGIAMLNHDDFNVLERDFIAGSMMGENCFWDDNLLWVDTFDGLEVFTWE